MKKFENMYIAANTPTICENLIKGYIWYSTSFLDGIKKRLDYERECHCCDADILRASINSKLYTILHDEKEFTNFLNAQRKKLVCPAYRTIQEYINKDYEFSGTVHELYNILQGA